jgi:hypothetical protein
VVAASRGYHQAKPGGKDQGEIFKAALGVSDA